MKEATDPLDYERYLWIEAFKFWMSRINYSDNYQLADAAIAADNAVELYRKRYGNERSATATAGNRS